MGGQKVYEKKLILWWHLKGIIDIPFDQRFSEIDFHFIKAKNLDHYALRGQKI